MSCGATPADLLVASMATKPISSTLQTNILLNYWSTNHVEYRIRIVMKQTQMYVCTLDSSGYSHIAIQG